MATVTYVGLLLGLSASRSTHFSAFCCTYGATSCIICFFLGGGAAPHEATLESPPPEKKQQQEKAQTPLVVQCRFPYRDLAQHLRHTAQTVA